MQQREAAPASSTLSVRQALATPVALLFHSAKFPSQLSELGSRGTVVTFSLAAVYSLLVDPVVPGLIVDAEMSSRTSAVIVG